MKFIVETHYSEEEGTDGDYYDIVIKDENNNVIKEFGDYYHDKGREKSEGFLLGVAWASQEKVEVESVEIADR